MDVGKKRIVTVFIILAVGFLILLVNAFRLQVMPNEKIIKLANKQYKGEVSLTPRRGDVFDRSGNPLAISMDFESIYADSKLITDKKGVSLALSKALNLDYSTVYSKIAKGKRFVWIKRLLTEEEAKKIEPLLEEERGLGTIKEPKRVYPNNTLASHVVGFVSRDAIGMDGVERFYNDYISNTNTTKIKYEKDAKGRPIYSDGNIFLSSDNGNTVYLTIDNNMQYQVERELKDTVEKRRALSGTVIVLNSKTGEVLALANYPTYDPNDLSKSNNFGMRNRAITDVFEPGSIFKIFSAALALKNKVIDMKTKIWGESGHFQLVGGKKPVIIKEAKGHDYGWMTISDLIAKSSNVGAAKLGLMVGEKKFDEGIDQFGFGNRTGVDLPGEVSGLINRNGGKVLLATMGFGQGLAATPIQIVRAYSIIANGGYDVTPHVVKKIVNERGEEMHDSYVQKGEQIISTDLAKQLGNMLRSAVEEGTATATDITGFEIAGKTGTAQKAGRGGYSLDKYAVSFAGFFPASDPQYTMLVLIDEPQGSYYAAVVAVPLFRTIANIIIQNQSVSPKVMPKYEPKNGKAESKDNDSSKKLDVPGDPNVVPNLSGLSLRQALTVISNNWDDVKMYGSGKVVRQTPAPGKRNPDDKIISIWLE